MDGLPRTRGDFEGRRAFPGKRSIPGSLKFHSGNQTSRSERESRWRGRMERGGTEWTSSIRRNGYITDGCVTGGC